MATERTSFVQRLFGAASLNASVYEEVETDPRATTQAFVVVLLSSLAGGIGATQLMAPGGPAGISLGSVLLLTALTLVAWAGWALLTFEVGYRLMPEPRTRTNPSELLRTLGFATTPGFLRVFGVFPEVTWPSLVVSVVWMIAAMVVAVRQALDYDNTSRAIAVCLVSFSLVVGAVVVLGAAFGSTLQ
jgi:hypothetical protein